jgi:hypothetical protein
LTEHLQRQGAHVRAVYLPSENGQKIGADDYLLTHTVQELEGIIEAPRARRIFACVEELVREQRLTGEDPVIGHIDDLTIRLNKGDLTNGSRHSSHRGRHHIP